MSVPSLSNLSSLSSIQDVPPPRFRWSTRVLLPACLLLALGGIFAASLASSLTPAIEVTAMPVIQRPALTPVVRTANSSGSSTAIVQAAGWIEPDPFPVSVGALTSGTVREVLFLEGESVTEGDVLVRLVEDDARLTLQRAEAELAAAEAAWNANIESVRALDVAIANVKETEASLALAKADHAAEKAMLVEAEKTFKRRESLRSTNSISESEFNTAEAEFDVRKARTDGAARRIDILEAQLLRARAEEKAAHKNSDLRIEERLRLDQARINANDARLQVSRLAITAPISGVVMRRMVEPGSRVMVGSDNMEAAHVAQLYDPRKLQVRVDVPLADAAKIGVGQRAEVIVEVLPERVFKGTVTRLTNLADIQKNTLQVKVALEDPAPELKPEMLARVRFFAVADDSRETNTAGDLAIFAPEEAISGSTAWIVADYDGEFGNAAQRSVQLSGATERGWKEVSSGLLPGDIVVTNPTATLTPGARLRVRMEGGSQ